MAEVQIWLLGATPEEALDGEIFSTIDDAMDRQTEENLSGLPGDERLYIYGAVARINPEQLERRG